MHGQEGSSKIKEALLTLMNLKIPFRRPVETFSGPRIILIENYVLTEDEILALHEAGKLDEENIRRMIARIKNSQKSGEGESHRSLEVMSDSNYQNRRRSQRVLLRVAVLIKTEISEGTSGQSLAFTQVVNAHGGLLDASFRMTADQRIILVNPQSGKEASCRIVRVDKLFEGRFPTAFEFDERSPSFWPISFPPVDWGVNQEVPTENR